MILIDILDKAKNIFFLKRQWIYMCGHIHARHGKRHFEFLDKMKVNLIEFSTLQYSKIHLFEYF